MADVCTHRGKRDLYRTFRNVTATRNETRRNMTTTAATTWTTTVKWIVRDSCIDDWRNCHVNERPRGRFDSLVATGPFYGKLRNSINDDACHPFVTASHDPLETARPLVSHCWKTIARRSRSFVDRQEYVERFLFAQLAAVEKTRERFGLLR